MDHQGLIVGEKENKKFESDVWITLASVDRLREIQMKKNRQSVIVVFTFLPKVWRRTETDDRIIVRQNPNAPIAGKR